MHKLGIRRHDFISNANVSKLMRTEFQDIAAVIIDRQLAVFWTNETPPARYASSWSLKNERDFAAVNGSGNQSIKFGIINEKRIQRKRKRVSCDRTGRWQSINLSLCVCLCVCVVVVVVVVVEVTFIHRQVELARCQIATTVIKPLFCQFAQSKISKCSFARRVLD